MSGLKGNKTEVPKRKCLHCGEEKPDKDFYKLHNYSNIYVGNNNYLPACKGCIKILYEQYKVLYKKQFSILGNTAELTEETETNENKYAIEKLAIKRVCMTFDLYYSDSLFKSALKNQEKIQNIDLLSAYMRMTNLKPNYKKSYDDTILEEDMTQELLKTSMVDAIREKQETDGLYQDIYNLCLKLMESLRKNCNVDFIFNN